MIRFLTNVRNHVNVISLGGAKILHVLHVIETQLAECFIFVLVIHVGKNSVNKIHIPEKSQLSKAKQDLDVLFAEIRKLQNQHRFAVGFFWMCLHKISDYYHFFLITDFIALIAINNLLDIQLLPSIPGC